MASHVRVAGLAVQWCGALGLRVALLAMTPGEKDRHLTYYRASVDQAKEYAELIRRGIKPTPAQTRLGRQMEKDERFWLATALMNLYHADGGSARVEAFAHLLERALQLRGLD